LIDVQDKSCGSLAEMKDEYLRVDEHGRITTDKGEYMSIHQAHQDAINDRSSMRSGYE
jgi:hypothetical protein